jgi:hypothetical protein
MTQRQQPENMTVSTIEQRIRREAAEEAEIFRYGTDDTEEEEQSLPEMPGFWEYLMEVEEQLRQQRKYEELFRAGPWC